MDENDWATAIRALSKLTGEPRADREDASASIHNLTGNVFLSGNPREIFSRDLVAEAAASQSFEKGSIAIEDLYGQYVPDRRQIEIFVRRLSADYRTFTPSLADLLRVIRLHEHAHAVIHLGIFAGDVEDSLSAMSLDGKTDWDEFLKKRDSAFAEIDSDTHELLAQALTWASVSQHREDRTLAETFLALQDRQAKKYRFDPAIKLGAASADWPLILQVARGEANDYREEGFALVKGIAALLRPSAAEHTASSDDPTVMQFLNETQQALANVDLITSGSPAEPPGVHKLLIARKGEVELRMYKETGHRRPHFHIEYKKEYSASYALDSFELLAGFMPRRYEDAMIPIARGMQPKLLTTWEQLNGNLRAVVRSTESAA
jgi:hypothetical protein